MNYDQFFNLMTGNYQSVSPGLVLLFIFLAIWSAVWKGLALWKSARLGSKGWFIALLLINTAGILEIIYIFFFAGKKNEEKSNIS